MWNLRRLSWLGLLVLGCESDEGDLEVLPSLNAPEVSQNDTSQELESGWCMEDEPLRPVEGEVGACTPEALELHPCGARVSTLSIGTGGIPGQGLDVDNDPATCAPVGNCEAGIDNQLSFLSGPAQAGVDEALELGTLMLFLEFVDPPGGPGEFALKMHVARLDESSENCDWTQEICSYRVREDSYDELCSPPVVFDDVTVDESGAFRTGQTGADISLNIPIFGASVSLPVRRARLEGEIEWGVDGRILEMSGLLVGGIPKSDLYAALEGIPEEELLAGSGLTKQVILDVIEAAVTNDLDLDGDGEYEAASFGAIVGAHPGIVVGWEKKL